MNDAAKPLQPSLDPDDVRRTIRLLDAIVADRTLLAALSEDDRIALLHAAGRVAHPERDAVSRLTKAVRRQRRQEKQERDREARASTGIRALRLQPVFSAPKLLPAPPERRPSPAHP